jgi:tRNA uridine 5-carboxymethylaminomethyl modification enzyme
LLKGAVSAEELLRRPQVNLEDIAAAMNMTTPDRDVSLTVQADIKYEGFVAKEKENVEKLRKLERTRIPDEIDYEKIDGLLSESRTKLARARPLTLGQASRISGVTPADISNLIMHITRTYP